MEEQMEDCVEGLSDSSDIDFEYEFDADHFYDFTQMETNSQVDESERWFEISGNYPPSLLALTVKLNLGKGIFSSSSNSKNMKSSAGRRGVDGESREKHKGIEDKGKAKTTCVPRSSKTRISTLMKPTASYLAKLNKSTDANSQGSDERSQIPTSHVEKKSLQNIQDNLATKRQKLEIGYLRKVAHLKHQSRLLHKMKVTIPKEPELETQQRAQNKRSRNNFVSRAGAERTQRTRILGVRPLNKKEFNTDDSSFASQSVRTNLRVKSDDALKDKYGTLLKNKARSINNKIFPTKEETDSVQNIRQEATILKQELQKMAKISDTPPTELFETLSLRSGLESDRLTRPKAHLPTKGSKENTPNSFQHEFWKSIEKSNQCGNGRAMAGMANQLNMSRSTGIR